MVPTNPTKKLLPVRAVCARYGDACIKTIDRWVEREILPEPIYINNRRYWDLAELEQRERANMASRSNTTDIETEPPARPSG